MADPEIPPGKQREVPTPTGWTVTIGEVKGQEFGYSDGHLVLGVIPAGQQEIRRGRNAWLKQSKYLGGDWLRVLEAWFTKLDGKTFTFDQGRAEEPTGAEEAPTSTGTARRTARKGNAVKEAEKDEPIPGRRSRRNITRFLDDLERTIADQGARIRELEVVAQRLLQKCLDLEAVLKKQS